MRVFLVLAAAAAASASALSLPDPKKVAEDMDKANSYFISQHEKPDCGWTRGTYWAGNMAHYLLTRNATYLDNALAWGDNFKWETCNYPHTLDEHSAANDYLCTQSYAQMAMLKKDMHYINNSIEVLKVVVDRAAVDDYWWIDAFFMGLPSFAALYNATGDTSFTEKMFLLFNDTSVNRTMWDAESSLYYRDQTYIGKKTPHGEKVFWGRGNGWAFAGLSRIVDWISPNDPHRGAYIEKLQLMANRLAELQGDDGFWRASLLDPLECPGPETTGSAMFAFGLAKGVNAGYFSRDKFLPVVLKAWKGLSTIALHDSGLVGYCQPVGGGPNNATSTDTSDFCVGQFLLAGSEMARLGM